MNSTLSEQKPSDDLASRKCALDIFALVIDRKNALDVTIDRSTEYVALDKRDRAFVRMMLSTCLRRLGQIDDLITFAQDRPDALKTPIIKNILRLGITQIFFMDVPDHASVDTSVRLAQMMGLSKQKGFINAILRKVIREGKTRLENQDAPRLNTPDWLLKTWIDDYGLKTAAEIAQANMQEASLDISIKINEDINHWAKQLDAKPLNTGTLRRHRGHVKELPGYNDGLWWVQDAAASIPAKLFGNLEGEEVLDFCAAPGGKTMQLADQGAHVVAIDRSVKRLKKVEENLLRIKLLDKITIAAADAAVWAPRKPARHILLDAPCSATGTIRRHPDNVHLKTPKDIEGLCTIQKRLLNHAAHIMETGATLIYCTCSLQKAEGEHQIDDFLSRHPNFTRKPITAEEIGQYKDFINEHGDLRILPFMLPELGGLDGFFVSRLIKNS